VALDREGRGWPRPRPPRSGPGPVKYLPWCSSRPRRTWTPRTGTPSPPSPARAERRLDPVVL